MVATTNKGLEKPARGSLSGVWDTPVNANMDIIDSSFGGVANIAMLSTGVTLSTAQAQCAIIHITGAITNHLPLIFPAIGGVWTIINDCVNLQTYSPYAYPAAGGRYCGLRPGTSQIMSDGTNMRNVDLPPVGSLIQVASNQYPIWVLLSSFYPYLNCDGSGFSPSTYPLLYYFLNGGTTVPDFRGRVSVSPDAGTGRMTGVYPGGVNYGGAAGDQYLHSHAHSASGGASGNVATGYNLDHSHLYAGAFDIGADAGDASGGGDVVDQRDDQNTGGSGSLDHSHTIGVTVNANGSGGHQNIPPFFCGGITLIRTGE